MPTVKLPINVGANENVEEVGMDGYGAAMVDCYLDRMGNIHKRPGLLELCDLGTSAPVDGNFWWNTLQYSLGVSSGKCFKITDAAGTVAEITGDDLASGVRPKFGDYGSQLYAANGGRMIKITSAATAYVADADAPITVTHVGVLNKYVLANKTGTDDYYWTGFTAGGEPDPNVWEGYYSSAEGRVDNITALGVSNFNVYLAGPQSVEVHYNDASGNFTREQLGVVNSGVIAPYSFTYCGFVNTWCWLDQDRSVVMLNGMTTIMLSDSLNKYIQGFASVSDMIGDFAMVAGQPMYFMSFPTEGKTLFYDFYLKYWGEWGYWNSGTAEYNRHKMNCICTCPQWNLTLVGDRTTGKVYKISTDYETDNGDTIRSMIRTPHVNHDTDAKKRSHKIYVRCKKTDPTATSTTPAMLIKWRDDGETTWKTERTLSLDVSGKTDFTKELDTKGVYRSRQWQFTMADPLPIALVSIREEFDYL